jgi:hypothetical protein
MTKEYTSTEMEQTWRGFDTLDGIDPRVKTDAFKKAKMMFDLVQHTGKLHSLLTDMVYHQSRMVDKWADGDDNVKNKLWKNLHESGDEARKYLQENESNK